MKQTKIFTQLLINIIVPVTIALISLGFFMYFFTKNILEDADHKKNKIIYGEIQNIWTFQDFSLSIIEKHLDAKIKNISNSLVTKYFTNTSNITTTNLNEIQKELLMEKDREDIYIIDARSGKIINTTYAKDLNVNVFTFGDDFKNFLMNVIKNKKFVSERFSVETSSNKIKKYAYQPTTDGKYIIETGVYSADADSTKKLIPEIFEKIKQKDSSISNVELFIGSEEPISRNSGKKLNKNDRRKGPLMEVFKNKNEKSIQYFEGEKFFNINFIYMERNNTQLYKDAVISITTDRTGQQKLLYSVLQKLLLIFSITLIIVVIVIYFSTRIIVSPVKKLLHNVSRIKDGNFSERAEVVGHNEISALSERFNDMISTIEVYYQELEEKVKLRTEEIFNQKEKIEKQKKRITDSINYAKFIQDAILPPFRFIKMFVPELFVLFKPRDIVSGDFYWLYNKDGKTFFALVDCTGHGVPGGFMSMIGHTLLNEIIKQNKIYNLREVLLQLNKGIIQTLNQVECEQDDGMDLTICCIDKTAGKIDVAVANQTALIIQDGKPTIIKGGIFSIGGFLSQRGTVDYISQSFDITKDTKLYMFSDGLPDQTGSRDRSKFSTERLIEKLQENHQYPMMEQMKKLDSEVENWKENEKQTDDILVIGIKV